MLGCLTITLSYSNERFKSQDTLDNITNEPISGGYEIPDHIIENLKKGNVPQASPFGIKASSTDLNGFTGENMDNLTGYEDYTNYKGVDHTEPYYSIKDLQEENRNDEIRDVLSIFISFLMPLGFYLLYKLLKKMIIIANESE